MGRRAKVARGWQHSLRQRPVDGAVRPPLAAAAARDRIHVQRELLQPALLALHRAEALLETIALVEQRVVRVLQPCPIGLQRLAPRVDLMAALLGRLAPRLERELLLVEPRLAVPRDDLLAAQLRLSHRQVLGQRRLLTLQRRALLLPLGERVLSALELHRQLAIALVGRAEPLERRRALLAHPLQLRRQAERGILRAAPIGLGGGLGLRRPETLLDRLVALPGHLGTSRLGAVGTGAQRRALVAQPRLGPLQQLLERTAFGCCRRELALRLGVVVLALAQLVEQLLPLGGQRIALLLHLSAPLLGELTPLQQRRTLLANPHLGQSQNLLHRAPLRVRHTELLRQLRALRVRRVSLPGQLLRALLRRLRPRAQRRLVVRQRADLQLTPPHCLLQTGLLGLACRESLERPPAFLHNRIPHPHHVLDTVLGALGARLQARLVLLQLLDLSLSARRCLVHPPALRRSDGQLLL